MGIVKSVKAHLFPVETLDQRGCESADVLPGSSLAPNVVNALLSGLCKVGARGARNEQDVAPTYSRV